MAGLANIVLVAMFSVVTILVFSWALRGLFGVKFSIPRLIIAGIITFSLVSPIIDSLPGSFSSPEYQDQDGLFPAVWISLLGMVIAILIGMVFLVIAEALIPSDTIPGPIYMTRAFRMWLRRTRRYLEITWILLKHGVSLGSIGGNRAQMRSAEGREFMAGKVRDALSESGVTFVKLGQILSTRRDLLPAEFIQAFSTLQTHSRPLPWSEMEAAIIASLHGRHMNEVFSEISREPLASASIAQVHTARLHSGEEVVLKIRRPGIRGQVERDLDIVDRLAMQMERSISWGREMGVRDLAAGFANALRNELDLTVEARNMNIIAAGMRAGDAVIPKVYTELSTSDMLVMERIRGTTLSGVHLRDVPGDRHQIADTIFESLLHQMLVCGTFHADPHPGNIMVMDNGHATLLDFGSVGRIDKVTRQAIIRMLIAWEFGDPISATDALLVMVDRPANLNERQLERDMGAFIVSYLAPGASVNAQAVADLFGIVARNGLTMPPDLATSLRAIGTMEGTLTWLVPGYNIVGRARQFAEHHLKEMLRPRSMQALLTEELTAMLPLIQRLPRRIDRITAAMEEGRFNINVATFAHEREREVVRGLMQELLLTILAAASGVMAAMLIRQDAGPMLVPSMSVFQFMGYFLAVLALILAMRVLIFVFRR